VGQEAKVKVDALGDKEIKAVVTQKNPLAISRSDTTGGLSNRVNVQEAKEFKVTLELRELPEDVQSSLRPGMSSTATITTNTRNNVLAVPLESIVEKAPAPAASPAATVAGNVPSTSSSDKPKTQKGVYLIEGNKVRFIEVTTGITGEADIEVTSGLQATQEIVRGPSRVLKTLKDGMTVKRQTRKPGTSNNEAS
jgi:HlyD family secretion protein